MLDEQLFNLEIRQLLKRFGVAAQREVEKVVRSGIESGKLSGDEELPASITLAIDDIELRFRIEGMIALSRLSEEEQISRMQDEGGPA